MNVSFVCGEQLDFFLGQILFSQELAKVVIESSNKPVAMMRNLGRSVRREVDAETEENLGTLLQFVPFGNFVDTEFPATESAFPASVAQGVQLRSSPTVRTQ